MNNSIPQVHAMQMTINVNIPVITREEDGVVVAECPLLDIVTQGNSVDDAKNNLVEAVGLFLGTCIEMGTFSQVMKECGLVKAPSQEDANDNTDHLEVPLPFIAAKEREACHA
jgi:predicted RNase H-like HicB family nuclease